MEIRLTLSKSSQEKRTLPGRCYRSVTQHQMQEHVAKMEMVTYLKKRHETGKYYLRRRWLSTCASTSTGCASHFRSASRVLSRKESTFIEDLQQVPTVTSTLGEFLINCRKQTEWLSDFSFSLGLSVEKENGLAEVVWGSPAFKAGL